jgi:putative effector of murein hydrolase LrgA (UPF0299 family)
MEPPIVKSEPFTLNKFDWAKIFKDSLYFFLVPLGFYITAVLGVIQQQGHLISLKDFEPSNITIIVIVAWLLNQLLSVIRKYVA